MQWSKTKHAENTMLELQLRSKGRLRRDVAKRSHKQSGSTCQAMAIAISGPTENRGPEHKAADWFQLPHIRKVVGRLDGVGWRKEARISRRLRKTRRNPHAPDHCVHQGKRSVKLSSSQLPRAYKSCVRCSSTVLAATASRYVRSVAACAHLPRSCISENAMP